MRYFFWYDNLNVRLFVTNPTLVFCGTYKESITHHAIYAGLKNITRKSGIPFLGVYATRHTHTSMLLDAGANMKEIQERLRHSSVKMTMDIYGHLSKETKEKQLKN